MGARDTGTVRKSTTLSSRAKLDRRSGVGLSREACVWVGNGTPSGVPWNRGPRHAPLTRESLHLCLLQGHGHPFSALFDPDAGKRDGAAGILSAHGSLDVG